MQKTKCGSCGTGIFYVPTAASGTLIPLNAEPDPDKGNMVILDGKAVAVTNDLFAPHIPAGAPKYLSHFATCPHGHQHRRKKK